MTTHKPRLRQLHRIVAPIMVLPVLLTLINGSLYQLVDLGGKGDAFQWLLNIHKGHFGIFNLTSVRVKQKVQSSINQQARKASWAGGSRRSSRKSSSRSNLQANGDANARSEKCSSTGQLLTQ